jgi:hypothetical protein
VPLGPLGTILEGGTELLASDLNTGTGHGPDSGCAKTGKGVAPLGVEMNFYRAVPGRVKDCTRIRELGSRKTPRGTKKGPGHVLHRGPDRRYEFST